ncbi:MAG: phosphatidylglycerophosphatase A [Candidatus Latescibacterota bacterium]
MSDLVQAESTVRRWSWIASGGGVGLSPLAPGTAGSLLGLLIYVLLPRWPPIAWVGMIGVFFFVGIRAATRAETLWGHDAGRIVIDEIVGMWVALLFLPRDSVRTALLCFLLFRLCDIVKPFPAYRSQRLPAGWGVMVDDVIAGIYANGLVRLVDRMLY